jgi:hypothetical protein
MDVRGDNVDDITLKAFIRTLEVVWGDFHDEEDKIVNKLTGVAKELAREAANGHEGDVKDILKGFTPTPEELRAVITLAVQRGHNDLTRYLIERFEDQLKLYERGIFEAACRVNDLYRNPIRGAAYKVSILEGRWFAPRYETTEWERDVEVGKNFFKQPFHQRTVGAYFYIYSMEAGGRLGWQ